MEHDYYQILGVPPTADLNAIKKAFRRKVIECHPDRGGSHAEMVLVNEAWEVLSNAELRSRYDAARNHASDTGAQEAAATDAQGARRRAEQYPRRWADVESWLNRVAGDFSSASHSSTRLLGEWYFPTVQGSYSGVTFIAVGLILGAIISISQFYNSTAKDSDRQLILLGCLGGWAGAWVGAWFHRVIADTIKDTRVQTEKVDKEDGSRQSSADHGGDQPAPRIIPCEKCSQKLRVPALQSELLVTCKSCGQKFLCPPVTGEHATADNHHTMHGPEPSSQPQRPNSGTQEWTIGAVLGVTAALLFTAGFLLYLVSEVGALWGDGKSRNFWGNLRVGIILVVVAGFGTAIWINNTKKR